MSSSRVPPAVTTTASTLSGTTLASNVTASSLTSFGAPLLSTTALAASTSQTITLPAGTYSTLVFGMDITSSSGNIAFQLQFNGDTAANYWAAGGAADVKMYLSPSARALYPAYYEWSINQCGTNPAKRVEHNGIDTQFLLGNATSNNVWWINSAAVTSVTIIAGASTFTGNLRIYGIR